MYCKVSEAMKVKIGYGYRSYWQGTSAFRLLVRQSVRNRLLPEKKMSGHHEIGYEQEFYGHGPEMQSIS
jgi:hypothetical protein